MDNQFLKRCNYAHKILANEVHIWQINLQISEAQITDLTNILSEDEQTRANRFKFSEHRNRFIAARGFLRQVISNYLDIPNHKIKFSYSDRGKPQLINQKLNFNVSHSQDMALYAFSKNYLIGVDLENLSSNVDCLKIAQRFFNQQEYNLIQSLEKEQQNKAFYHLWTAKEAYLKATGEGLAGGLDKISIDITQPSQIKLLSVAESELEINNWSFFSLIPQTDFIATVAVKNYQQNLIFKQF